MCEECLPTSMAAEIGRRATQVGWGFLLMCCYSLEEYIFHDYVLLNCDVWKRGLNKQDYNLF